jgi:hypothetical protein
MNSAVTKMASISLTFIPCNEVPVQEVTNQIVAKGIYCEAFH